MAIGKPRLTWAAEAVRDYSRRLQHSLRVEVRFLKVTARGRESKDLLDATEGTTRIALDERGELFSTADLAKHIASWRLHGPQRIAFLIGSADGHSDALRATADSVWALSPLTLQHEFALVLLLEQLYRASSILAGSPYHRGD